MAGALACLALDHAKAKGLVFVLITALIWVAASFIVQNIDADLNPFPLTYIANSLFTLYLPIVALCAWWQKHRQLRGSSGDGRSLTRLMHHSRTADCATTWSE